MKRIRLRFGLTWLLAVAFALLIGGCMGGTTSQSGEQATSGTVMQDKEAEAGMRMTAEYHSLTQAEAKARMDSGDAVVILDVRTKEEYDAGHIPGAILLPNEDIGTEMPPELPDQNAEILVYCRLGNRSAQASKKLVGMGYTAVFDFGGINSWTYGVVTD